MERFSLFWVCSALIVSVAAPAQAQNVASHMQGFVANQMLNNAVRIEARSASRTSPEFGLGMIIGRSGDLLWIATAAHVVFGNERGRQLPLRPAENITVEMRNGTKWQTATVPDKAGGHDLALLAIRVPYGRDGPDDWREQVAIETPVLGTEVRLAGTSNEIRYGPSGARIVAIAPDGELEIAGLIGEDGQSGGAIAAADGFVGMYVQSAGRRMIPMKVIREAALAANRPYQLTAPPPRPVPVTVCLVNENGDPYKPRLSGAYGLSGLAANGCAAAYSGTNMLAPEPGMQCEPRQLELPPDPHQTIRFQCYVDPVGIWTSSDDGYLSIVALGENLWSVEGLASSPYGLLTGVMRGKPPSLQLDIKNSLGIHMTGSVTLQPRRMHGKFAIGATVYQLEVSR